MLHAQKEQHGETEIDSRKHTGGEGEDKNSTNSSISDAILSLLAAPVILQAPGNVSDLGKLRSLPLLSVLPLFGSGGKSTTTAGALEQFRWRGRDRSHPWWAEVQKTALRCVSFHQKEAHKVNEPKNR